MNANDFEALCYHLWLIIIKCFKFYLNLNGIMYLNFLFQLFFGVLYLEINKTFIYFIYYNYG